MNKSRRIRWLEYVALTKGKKNPYSFGRKSRRKGSLAKFRHDGKIILKRILMKKVWESVDRIRLSQNMDQERALLNTVMKVDSEGF
jgi:hypothetical protein